MRQRQMRPRHTRSSSPVRERTVKLKCWRTTAKGCHRCITPQHATAASETNGLERGFFGGKSRGVMRGWVFTLFALSTLGLAENTCAEALSVVLQQPPNAADACEVCTDPDHWHERSLRMRRMITPHRLALAFFTVAAITLAQAPPPVALQAIAQLVPAATPWQVLFDGSNSAAWVSYGKGTPPSTGWGIKDGALHIAAHSGGGDLRTVAQYGDFELRFSWKVGAGANSGVMYRSSEGEHSPWVTGPEYQILDDGKHADGKEPKTSAGGLYALYAAEGKALAAVGQWNEARIIARGHHVEHWLNGVRVVDAQIGSDDWNTRVAASKWKDAAKYGKSAKGHIVLQDHGDDVWFKDIRIREYTGADVALFDGKSFNGWKRFIPGVETPATWSINEGVLVCAGQPAGYIRTEATHTNYILRLDWRFNADAAGNSGVLLRQIEEDRVWPRSIEAQLQSGSAGDFWNIGDFVMSGAPERTKGRNTKATSTHEKPLGEWNSYEIEVDGPNVELRVNGRVLNSASACAVVAGHIGLQSEGVPIMFRNIRMTPLP